VHLLIDDAIRRSSVRTTDSSVDFLDRIALTSQSVPYGCGLPACFTELSGGWSARVGADEQVCKPESGGRARQIWPPAGQYTSEAFAAAAEELGITRSVGRTGNCFDNALVESFNAAVKVERVHRTVYPTRAHARADVTRYIEFRYNRRRLHSALGYRTPQEVHDKYLNSQLAA
jgi:putative transposase